MRLGVPQVRERQIRSNYYSHSLLVNNSCIYNMSTTKLWQSQVEIKHYSVAYFNCISAFAALQHRTSVKGGGSYMMQKLMNT